MRDTSVDIYLDPEDMIEEDDTALADATQPSIDVDLDSIAEPPDPDPVTYQEVEPKTTEEPIDHGYIAAIDVIHSFRAANRRSAARPPRSAPSGRIPAPLKLAIRQRR